ncbi:tRNA (adenine(22)-N(1))-methyltransferase [Gracilibacillus massiliensis]|uniref:tRNA (adenine(22)-N(1))-methyltransferase n=1 Tax=Gracilibacillus massiliensis TaxID=1564956 RepID=UPI00071C92F7|nr:tRNA (adenine(22)-N(1))-methyltransferase TrmK [Gracilibacillus massiliensis]
MLSNRLKQLANYLKEPINFADIGSDHAYLPCYVCQQHPTAKAIAGEINQGPFERARQTVLEYQLMDQVDVRKGNGLSVIEPGEVQQVTIAGMGGKLIRTILEEGEAKLTGVHRLILQPNIDAQIVRRWLVKKQYKITAEEIIDEDGYIYEIIAADLAKEKQNLTEKELLFGPFLLKECNQVFRQKWAHEKDKRLKLIEQMKQASQPPMDKINLLEKQLNWIEEVLTSDNG